VNDLEERLRENLKEYAQRAQPHSIRPLQDPRPRARARTARWLAPVAAAAAVIAVVAVVSVAGKSAANRPAPAGAPAGTPRYYVTEAAKLSSWHPPKLPRHGGRITPQDLGQNSTAVTVTVRDTASGQVVSTMPLPTLKNLWPIINTGVSAAANDRLFAIDSGPSVYLLSINADGQPVFLHQVRLTSEFTASLGVDLSPDGKQLAFNVESCQKYCSFGIEVLTLATGAHKSWFSGWLGSNNAAYWTANGRQLLISTTGSKNAFWLLNAAGPGGNLATDAQPLKLRETTAAVLPSPDGRSLIMSTFQVNRDHTVTGKIVTTSVSTGKVEQVLYSATIRYHSHPYYDGVLPTVLALGPTGLRPLVLCFGLGWIENGKFRPLPGGPALNTSNLYWNAAW
jgi:hypothetical protein